MGIRAISEGPHESVDPFTILPVNDLLISGTTLEFISGAKNSAKLRISPADANHIAYWRFEGAIPLVLTIPTSGRISIYAPATNSPSTCAPFVDEDIPRKVSLVFVFNTPTKNPLWEIGRPSWNKMRNLKMGIYGFEDGDVNNFMKRGVKQVNGFYFEHREWPTQICASLAPLLGHFIKFLQRELKRWSMAGRLLRDEGFSLLGDDSSIEYRPEWSRGRNSVGWQESRADRWSARS